MKYYFLTILTLLSFITRGQETTDPKELFDEGQYFFQREEYKEALYYYTRLVQQFDTNSNFNFKVGECYLKIPGQEHLAVSYFEKAIKNIVPKKDYRKNSYDEISAPLHAMFYLGNAYRVAGRLDDALKIYAKFVDSPYFYGNYNLGIVENEIKYCERAKVIQDTPVEVERKKMDKPVNSEYSNFNPVLSGNGEIMVFVRGLKFYDAIMMVHKTESGWSEPVNINPEIVSDGDFYPTGLNSDGTILLLVKEQYENSDIYISYYQDSKWTQAVPIPGRINTYVSETYAAFGRNDDIIYLVSDRQGGEGGLDIYTSALGKNGLWGKPKNMGKTINSEEDEETPVICNDGQYLFFSSKGHYNMGGYDIFYSILEDKKWSIPRNIGYPMNTTRDDLFYQVDNNCNSGYFSIIDSETGISDIYKINIAIPELIP